MASKKRDQGTTEEIEAARKQQQVEGSDSFFVASTPKIEPENEKPQAKSATLKKKFTEVGFANMSLQNELT